MSILCYHAVDPRWRSPISVTPAEFEAHAEWLARHRRVVPLQQTDDLLDRSGRLPPRIAALTFDDGFASVFHHAFPVLMRHRLPATVFLVAQTLTAGGRTVDWVDGPPALPPPTLTRDQVLEMQEAGVAFGSHSFSHVDLRALRDEECERDLRQSREVLEAVLGGRVDRLAYPRGLHDERVRRAARRAGFVRAYTLPEAPEPAGDLSIPRVGVYPGNGRRSLRVKTWRGYLPLRTSRVFPVGRRLLRGGSPAPARVRGRRA